MKCAKAFLRLKNFFTLDDTNTTSNFVVSTAKSSSSEILYVERLELALIKSILSKSLALPIG